MDFGKLERVDGVDFSLPPLPERTRKGLEKLGPAPDEPWLYVGAPAWARKDWLGKFYPAGTPQNQFLAEYGKRCGAIELNASYYSVPKGETIAEWLAVTPPGFLFVPKLHRSLTHDGEGLAAEDAAETAASIARHLQQHLGERLGPIFIQLPPMFTPSKAPLLDRVLETLGVPAQIEFRHAACFKDRQPKPELVDLLARRRAGTVITDVAGRRDVCHSTLTAPELMVRFVGNGLHPSDFTRVDAWLERLAELRAAGLRRCFFFVHQPDDVLAPELMAYVGEAAAKRGMPVHVPRPKGQMGLF